MTLLETIIDYSLSFFRDWYTRLIAAIVILLIGFIIAKIIERIIYKLLHDLGIDSVINKAAKIDLKIEKGISVFAKYFIYFITIIMVLNQLNVTTTVLQMLSAAIIIILIISVVLAIKDFVPNAFAGFFLYRNRFIKKGEFIRVKGMEGMVVDITLVETKLETKDGDTVYIPNSVLTKTEIVKLKNTDKKTKKRVR
ncbi:MAG: mechanosensitive ion channel family protein [Nanoarchaeota archaeon]|nr:mechanosensitive ion channel family protein [Nanoarchaeota archaeon]